MFYGKIKSWCSWKFKPPRSRRFYYKKNIGRSDVQTGTYPKGILDFVCLCHTLFVVIQLFLISTLYAGQHLGDPPEGQKYHAWCLTPVHRITVKLQDLHIAFQIFFWIAILFFIQILPATFVLTVMR